MQSPAPPFGPIRVGLITDHALVRAGVRGMLAPYADRFVWLAPEPRERFVELVRTTCARFPEFPPYEGEGGEPEPHLTIGAVEESSPTDLVARIEYRHVNLVAEPFPLAEDPFDVVLLRNVLIYFRPESQRRVVASVARRLAADGVLFVGPSESLFQLTDALRPIAQDAAQLILAQELERALRNLATKGRPSRRS